MLICKLIRYFRKQKHKEKMRMTMNTYHQIGNLRNRINDCKVYLYALKTQETFTFDIKNEPYITNVLISAVKNHKEELESMLNEILIQNENGN